MRCWRSCWICDRSPAEKALKLLDPEWAKGGRACDVIVTTLKKVYAAPGST
jgi:hypothetical protein